MEQIIFTNGNGETIILDKGKPFLLQSFSGTGGIDADVQMTKAPYQDGETHTSTLLNTRTLSFEVAIFADSQEELYQRKSDLMRILNPKLGKGLLTYRYGNRSKEIEVVVDSAPVFPTGMDNSGIGFQRTIFTLLCPSPFWMDIYTESEEIADWIGGLTFPLTLETIFAERGKQRSFVNDGDVETPIEVVFYGMCENPTIKNLTTGEFIKVNKLIDENQKLIITTHFGNKKVEIEDSEGIRTNAFNYIDLSSKFIQLSPGNNLIEYSADNGEEETRVLVKWKNRYLGI